MSTSSTKCYPVLAPDKIKNKKYSYLAQLTYMSAETNLQSKRRPSRGVSRRKSTTPGANPQSKSRPSRGVPRRKSTNPGANLQSKSRPRGVPRSKSTSPGGNLQSKSRPSRGVPRPTAIFTGEVLKSMALHSPVAQFTSPKVSNVTKATTESLKKATLPAYYDVQCDSKEQDKTGDAVDNKCLYRYVITDGLCRLQDARFSKDLSIASKDGLSRNPVYKLPNAGFSNDLLIGSKDGMSRHPVYKLQNAGLSKYLSIGSKDGMSRNLVYKLQDSGLSYDLSTSRKEGVSRHPVYKLQNAGLSNELSVTSKDGLSRHPVNKFQNVGLSNELSIANKDGLSRHPVYKLQNADLSKDLSIGDKDSASSTEHTKLPCAAQIETSQNNWTKGLIYPLYSLSKNTAEGNTYTNIGSVKIGGSTDSTLKDKNVTYISLDGTPLEKGTCNTVNDKHIKQSSNKYIKDLNKGKTRDQIETKIHIPPTYYGQHSIRLETHVNGICVDMKDENKIIQKEQLIASTGEGEKEQLLATKGEGQKGLVMFPVNRVTELTGDNSSLHLNLKGQQDVAENAKAAPVYLVPNKHFLESRRNMSYFRESTDNETIDSACLSQDDTKNQLDCFMQDVSSELSIFSMCIGAECEITSKPFYTNTEVDKFSKPEAIAKAFNIKKRKSNTVVGEESKRRSPLTVNLELKETLKDTRTENKEFGYSVDNTDKENVGSSIQSVHGKAFTEDDSTTSSTSLLLEDGRRKSDKEVLHNEERFKILQTFDFDWMDSIPCVSKKEHTSCFLDSEDKKMKRLNETDMFGKADIGKKNTSVGNSNGSRKRITVEISSSPINEDDGSPLSQNMHVVVVKPNNETFYYSGHDHPYCLKYEYFPLSEHCYTFEGKYNFRLDHSYFKEQKEVYL